MGKSIDPKGHEIEKSIPRELKQSNTRPSASCWIVLTLGYGFFNLLTLWVNGFTQSHTMRLTILLEFLRFH